MKPDITIVVSSYDGAEDTWEPFFKLFSTYWPGCDYPVYLVTETKRFSYPGLPMQCFNTGVMKGGPTAWGRRLIKSLEAIKSHTVLYLQDDFFLTSAVDGKLIEEFAGYMAEMSWTHESAMHIGLCPRSSHGPFHLTEYPLLWEVDRQALYRFSLQPGLWNREELLRQIKPSDTAWDFELKSRWRSCRAESRVLTVNRHIFHPGGRLIYPFDPGGGIIGGKWDRASVVDLFKQHRIIVDFSRRGFTDEALINGPKPYPLNRIARNLLRLRAKRLLARINQGIDWFRT
jgi:hypothetical protein